MFLVKIAGFLYYSKSKESWETSPNSSNGTENMQLCFGKGWNFFKSMFILLNFYLYLILIGMDTI